MCRSTFIISITLPREKRQKNSMMKKGGFFDLSSCLDQFLNWPTREKEKDKLNKGSSLIRDDGDETNNNCGDHILDNILG